MALSRRERIIAIVCIAALAVLVLDHYALSPLLAANTRVKEELVAARSRQDQDTALLHRRDMMARKWDEMVAGGLKSDPAQTEGEVLHALESWGGQAGLALSSMRPDRATQGDELREITVRATGTGSMTAVAGFLWRLESSKMPLRVKNVQIGGREGTNDLSLQVQVSTLYLAPPSPKAPVPARPTEKEL